MDEELISKLKEINFQKIEKKTLKFVIGFLSGGLLILMLSKFVNDNFTFRIPKISNKPDPYKNPNEAVTN